MARCTSGKGVRKEWNGTTTCAREEEKYRRKLYSFLWPASRRLGDCFRRTLCTFRTSTDATLRSEKVAAPIDDDDASRMWAKRQQREQHPRLLDSFTGKDRYDGDDGVTGSIVQLLGQHRGHDRRIADRLKCVSTVPRVFPGAFGCPKALVDPGSPPEASSRISKLLTLPLSFSSLFRESTSRPNVSHRQGARHP